MFKKVLILNRGEIACRIARTLRRLGIASVAVYSDADANAPHVESADEALRLGPAPVRESYLDLEAVRRALVACGADAVHPGYGLMSESPALSRAVQAAGATFIGPPIAALERLGDKIAARELARSVGVEPPPGTAEPVDAADVERLQRTAADIGYPVMVKAAGGGGGIGMQIVRNPSELARSAKSCADRALQAFGDGRVYLERYLERPHHIEVQVLVGMGGEVIVLGERECSVQRRHQKVIEESPSPASFFRGEDGARRRAELWSKASAIVSRAGYRGAGTVEFVFDAEGRAYFLEVNARLQVEHPVTEMVTGLDLVEQQLRIASGEPLDPALSRVQFAGHAIEARLYAEDPDRGFLPQPGRLAKLRFPEGLAGVRVDSGVREGGEVTPYYDPLLAKVIAHGSDRAEAITRLDGALARTELELVGPKGPRTTNLALLRRVLAHGDFARGDYDTGLIERLGAPS